MSNDNNTRDNIPIDDNKFYSGHGGTDIGAWLAWRNSKINAENSAAIRKSNAEFEQKLQNGDFDTPNDAKQLDKLADFINANKQNNYINVQPANALNTYHPQYRNVRMNIYVDGITYAKLMDLIGDHNPADDYGSNK